ncbi:SANT/Myb domain-containing protein [Cupriavidus taiwanensis]|uniref:SANT/Myb-like DNA-binding domain-containing protein n=1 Tax=Cupriavidus taiwanensis TaxID=164546 RepID=UPI001573753D|nr:SANT/Myb-like DNA-binding domain-containing protein [Cupriavidus taiwanensis]NSX15005.1 SANT/Myb domain-containing protein [Cupriavidus taiwanensis]
MTAKTWNVWTPEEDELLRRHWGDKVSTKRLAERFPTRTPAAILKHGYVALQLGPRHCGRESFSPVWEGVKRLLAGGKMMTTGELATALQVTSHAVQNCMRERHGKEVHVGGYAKVAAHSTRVNRWALGGGPDAPMPQRKTKNEINREYSRRMRQDAEYCARQNQLARLRYAEKKGKLIRPDAAVAWMKAAPQHDAEPLQVADYRDTASLAHLRGSVSFPQAGASLLNARHAAQQVAP